MNTYRLNDKETGKLLGVATTADIRFVRMSAAKVPLVADLFDSRIFGLVVNDQIYAIAGRSTNTYGYPEVVLDYISYDEYKELLELFNKLTPDATDPVSTRIENAKLDIVREAALHVLSSEAKLKIYKGIQVEIQGELRQYELTIEDLINLNSILNQILRGQTEFVYHAKNQPACNYSSQEMQLIIDISAQFIQKVTLTYNRLKHFILECTDTKQINDLTIESSIEESTL